MFELPKDTIQLYIFIAFAAAGLVQLLYYMLIYSRLPVKQRKLKKESMHPVSVIICAQNEAENLRETLPKILSQNYRNFEVIVVNDCSEDNTNEVIAKLQQKFKNLRSVNINKELLLPLIKKMTLFIGIKEAKNELLLFTSPDCHVCSNDWISHISAGFSKKTDFVLAYTGIQNSTSSFEKYVKYDNLFLAMQYLGSAIFGLPIMCDIKNVACRKSSFFNIDGFGSHINLQNGEEWIFINGLARKSNTNVVCQHEAFLRSKPINTINEFIQQKTKHFALTKLFNTKSKLFLAFELISRLLFYTLGIVLLATTKEWLLCLCIFAVCVLIKMLIFWRATKALNEKRMLFISFLFDLISPFINLYIFLAGLKNRYRNQIWK